jgi:glutamate-ammonia-ligase adenylyltransferase
LRPSGNKGPIASRLEGFNSYHAESAWTWENMALTRARIVASPPELEQQISATLMRTLTVQRDPEILRADVATMRRRIAQENPGHSSWDIKHRPGGLVDIEFIAQYLMLRHAASNVAVLSTNTFEALKMLRDADLLDSGDAGILMETLRLWQNLQCVLRLTSENSATESMMPIGQCNLLVRAGGKQDMATLEAEMDIAANRVRTLFNAMIATESKEPHEFNPRRRRT